MNVLNPVTLFLLLNGLVIIVLVVTQNDSPKDSANQNSSRTTPLEIFLGISIAGELILLLIEQKITDF